MIQHPYQLRFNFHWQILKPSTVQITCKSSITEWIRVLRRNSWLSVSWYTVILCNFFILTVTDGLVWIGNAFLLDPQIIGRLKDLTHLDFTHSTENLAFLLHVSAKFWNRGSLTVSYCLLYTFLFLILDICSWRIFFSSSMMPLQSKTEIRNLLKYTDISRIFFVVTKRRMQPIGRNVSW